MSSQSDDKGQHGAHYCFGCFVCSKVANCIFDKMVQMLHTEIRAGMFFSAFALHVLVGGVIVLHQKDEGFNTIVLMTCGPKDD